MKKNAAEIMGKMARGEIGTGIETIDKKTYTTKDGELHATAKIEILRDVVDGTGEIVNGGVHVETNAGRDILYTGIKDYHNAILIAKKLVEHWDAGDFDWNPNDDGLICTKLDSF